MPLNLYFRKYIKGKSSETIKTVSDNGFNEAINLFKTERKKAGFSIEQLSNETKITKNVLIAIENGWKEYLPETTYLISMIKTIEIKLNLEIGSLDGIVEQKSNINKSSSFKFNFINIDFLNSWMGSLFYVFFMFLSILALNSQLRYLIKINSISTEPIITEKSMNKNLNNIHNEK